jgi:dynein heavy chain 1
MVTEYNNAHVDFPMETSHEQTFITNWLLFSLVWGLSGSMNQDLRLEFCSFIGNIWQHELPVDATNSEYTLIDYEVNIDDGGWRLWKVSVPTVDIESHRVMATDLIIPTVDTVRHLKVLEAWLGLHCPVILCGPPGSGKSMTLTSVLNSMPNFMLAPLNFSSGTTPELILKTFQQYCEYRSGRDGMTLSPSASSILTS